MINLTRYRNIDSVGSFSPHFPLNIKQLLMSSQDSGWKVSFWSYFIKPWTSVRLSRWLKSQLGSANAQKIVSEQGWKNLETNDEKILAILKYVHLNLKYALDIDTWGQHEYWADVDEILMNSTWKDDCDGGAVLILILAALSGIPFYQIRLCAGNVLEGGHAWIIYRAEYDGTWKVIDWCYHYDNTPMQIRKPFYSNSFYQTIWFWVNTEKGYGELKKNID